MRQRWRSSLYRWALESFLKLHRMEARKSASYSPRHQLAVYPTATSAHRLCRYAFSTSGSIAISETLKGLLSTILFYRECRQRQATTSGGYEALASQQSAPASVEDGNCNWSDTQDEENLDNEKSLPNPDRWTSIPLQEFVTICRNEIPYDNIYGFTQLALLYSLINNSVGL